MTILVLCGGLGSNQLYIAPSIYDAVRAADPTVAIVRVDDPGYIIGKIPPINDIIAKAKVANSSADRVVLVDHSMGWITGAKASLDGLVDFLIALDAVGLAGVTSDKWPRPARFNGERQPGILAKAMRPTPFIAQLYINDGPEIQEFDLMHNDLPHDPKIVQAVIDACTSGAIT